MKQLAFVSILICHFIIPIWDFIMKHLAGIFRSMSALCGVTTSYIIWLIDMPLPWYVDNVIWRAISMVLYGGALFFFSVASLKKGSRFLVSKVPYWILIVCIMTIVCLFLFWRGMLMSS